jgi:rRNA-processing protein FCF1
MGIMIFDTSYLIEHPAAINRLTGNLVVPAIVLKQLDGLKNSEKEGVAHKARAASNAIIEAQRSGRLTISVDYNKVDMLDNNADNVILGTAAKLKETYTEVILMTTDVNMTTAAESMGIGVEGKSDRREKQHETTMVVIFFVLIVIAITTGSFVLFGITFIGMIFVSILCGRRTSQSAKQRTGGDMVNDPGYISCEGNIYNHPSMFEK